ncbi:MAG: hypothetical protein WDA59_09410 [Methanofastidiosum sp.]
MKVICAQICNEHCGHKYIHEWSDACNECDLGLCVPISRAELQKGDTIVCAIRDCKEDCPYHYLYKYDGNSLHCSADDCDLIKVNPVK